MKNKRISNVEGLIDTSNDSFIKEIIRSFKYIFSKENKLAQQEIIDRQKSLHENLKNIKTDNKKNYEKFEVLNIKNREDNSKIKLEYDLNVKKIIAVREQMTELVKQAQSQAKLLASKIEVAANKEISNLIYKHHRTIFVLEERIEKLKDKQINPDDQKQDKIVLGGMQRETYLVIIGALSTALSQHNNSFVKSDNKPLIGYKKDSNCSGLVGHLKKNSSLVSVVLQLKSI